MPLGVGVGFRQHPHFALAAIFGRGHGDDAQGVGFVAADVAAVDDVVAAFPEEQLDVLVLGRDEGLGRLAGIGEIQQRDADLAPAQRGQEGGVFSVGARAGRCGCRTRRRTIRSGSNRMAFSAARVAGTASRKIKPISAGERRFRIAVWMEGGCPGGKGPAIPIRCAPVCPRRESRRPPLVGMRTRDQSKASGSASSFRAQSNCGSPRAGAGRPRMIRRR